MRLALFPLHSFFPISFMPTGTIKKLTDKGFGFIAVEGGGPNSDLFFHSSSVEGTDFNSLQEGAQVNFNVGTNPRDGRPRGENVTLAA